ncbi:MAG: MFS transporter, partial [Proteobacteria bacterium]|nr:MFS transporter [Pseudomonadota bacterium]MBU1610949.1 MFS transporter [Pseudomonadota bacterium]
MPPSPLTPRPFRAALPVLLLITSVFLLNFLSRVVLAPLMPAVRLELGISHAEAGSFFLIMAAGVSIGLLSNSFVSSRLTHRRTIALSALVTGVALIGASQVASLTVFKVLWALAGLGAGLYLPSGIATVTSLLEKKHWGKGLATHEMAPNGSFILAPILAELMLAVADWRTTLTFLGIAQVIIAFVFLRGCKAGAFPGAPIRRAIAGRILLRRSFWVMAVLFTLGVVASMGPYSMIPLYLVDMGWERTQANQLLAVSRILAFGMPFAAGWLVDRIGGKRTIGVYLVCASAATIFLGLAQGNWLTLAVLLQP